ncbi:MAG TPA: hypothetical protein VIV11_10340 [Kofleriaceae bacterium]
MSVIIYGARAYGTVEAHGGEHAETNFFHLWFVPLIPTGSYWITNVTAEGSVGYPIDMHAKSVLAGYLRVWGPIVALGGFVAGVAGNLPLLLVSALAIAATVLAWTWRNLRGDGARRRSDFNLVAFGTRCEPRRMRDELRAEFKRSLDATWSELKPDRTPNEIARHGTKDANEAVIAYGLLRIAAATRGRAGKEEDEDADRILAGAHTTLAVGDGPYREGVQTAPLTGSLASVVQDMATAQQASKDSSPEARTERLAQRKRRSRKQLLGLVLATPVALGGVGLFFQSVRPTRDVSLAELRSIHPPTGRTVRVTCDSIEPPIWEEVDSDGNTTHRIAMCALGKYFLPLRLDADGAVPERKFIGELREIHDRLIWIEQGLRHAPALEARTLEVFVDASDPHEKIFLGIFGLAISLGVPVLWVLWYRARRRRLADAL